MPKVHDRGGWPNTDPIERGEHILADWEQRVDALAMLLGQKGIRTTDESRRAIESLEQDKYESMRYYEKWAAGMEILLVEKGILTTEEIDAEVAKQEQGTR